MIHKSVKKYLLEAAQDETGALLIVSFLIMVLLTIVGGAALTNLVIVTKISANFKKSASAFYIADAGIELGKFEFTKQNPRNIVEVLVGTDTLVGANPCYTGNNLDNGVVFTNQPMGAGSFDLRVSDDDEDGDFLPCPADHGGPENCWVDTNDKFILTATGRGQGNTKSEIEALVWSVPFDVPGAITLVDNGNATNDADPIILDWPNNNATIYGDFTTNLRGVLITGDDTNDGSNTVGNGPGPDTGGLVAQEGPPGFVNQGSGNLNDSDILILDDWGFNEGAGIVCNPAGGPPCYAVISGGTEPAYTDNVTGGPTENQMKDHITRLKAMATETTTAAALSGSGFGPTLGSPTAPVIASINVGDSWHTMDQELEGWGILILEGRLRLDPAPFGPPQDTIRWHGIIYLSCRGHIRMQDDPNDLFEIQGAIIMVNNDDGTCGGGSAEERLEFTQGTAHIYYSSEAISKFAAPLAFETLAWREID